MIELDAGAIYALQKWLEYDNGEHIRLLRHKDVKIAERFDVTKVYCETIELERGVINTGHGWMIEFAYDARTFKPVMFGNPTSPAAYHEKRGRR